MLVGYSSSEEESEGEAAASSHTKSTSPRRFEGEEDDGAQKKKKPRTQEHSPKTRLPLPGCVLAMFPEEEEPMTEDSSLHGGRIRTFKHERGNWATHVYLPYHPEEDLMELLEELLSALSARGMFLSPQEEFHLSLSQTVVLRHHWIQPFQQNLRDCLVHQKRFVCSAARLKVYCNAERTRTFLGMEVCTGHTQLLELVQAVDRTMAEFHLDTFYKDPSFHVTLAWCVGDVTKQMQECLQDLQHIVDDREDGPFLLKLNCVELRCRMGNKTFHFPLEP